MSPWQGLTLSLDTGRYDCRFCQERTMFTRSAVIVPNTRWVENDAELSFLFCTGINQTHRAMQKNSACCVGAVMFYDEVTACDSCISHVCSLSLPEPSLFEDVAPVLVSWFLRVDGNADCGCSKEGRQCCVRLSRGTLTQLTLFGRLLAHLPLKFSLYVVVSRVDQRFSYFPRQFHRSTFSR